MTSVGGIGPRYERTPTDREVDYPDPHSAEGATRAGGSIAGGMISL
jgi:hypothetical protein